MALPEFFRPEKNKWIVFCIFLALGLLALLVGFLPSSWCLAGQCSISFTEKIFRGIVFVLFFGLLAWPFVLMMKLEGLIYSQVNWLRIQDIPFVIAAIVLSLAWLYFLACLGVWLYHKFKA